ncbi:hypothetical protein Aglo03_51890 [Actinokineospora globicatena]|uniref:Uncharacterized protein n=1 Tax=Actinokineospora globicatena TaxID=103729 RepID=A0A9W6QPW8_9PSEU|nr:hypothetical protein Aglo03_51890 [Actinokineospora globicatena]
MHAHAKPLNAVSPIVNGTTGLLTRFGAVESDDWGALRKSLEPVTELSTGDGPRVLLEDRARP